MNPFDTFLINPILNLLMTLFKILEIASIPWSLGFAIILLTTLVRLALWPLTTAQLKSTQKMAALKPHLDRIKSEHGHDKVRHQQEVTKLYKEHGVNPLAGCLPLLLQIPVFIALYNVLLKIVQFDQADFLTNINSRLYIPNLHLSSIPDTSFFGLSLANKPSDWQHAGIFLLLIPVFTGLFQFIQSKMIAPAVSSQPKVVKNNQGKADMEDTMSQVSSQMTMIMPVMIAFFSYQFAFGLSLYWNTFTIIGIIQQYIISGPGGMNKYLPKKWQK